MKRLSGLAFGGIVLMLAGIAGCGKSDSGGNSGAFPSITPPIKAATPAGLKNSGVTSLLRSLDERALTTAALSISQFETNFFGTGPTVLFNITAAVDDRINFFNTQTTTSGCLTATPVAYTITPAGQANPVTMYAQCYQSVGSGFTGDPGLIMIGKNAGITYVWNAVGAAWVAAIATPDGSSFDIHAWYSVGIGNGVTGAGSCGAEWDACSYGVAEVSTNVSTGAFEMAAAGIGIGYYGVQFASDGTNTYGIGCEDGCSAPASLCVKSSDESTPATGGICTASTQFSGTTAIGLVAGTGPTTTVGPVTWTTSLYPTGSGNVVLTGAAGDSVHFGPTVPPTGVIKF